MNVPIEEIEKVLLENKIDNTKVNKIIQQLTEVVAEIKDDNKSSSEPKQKYEFVIILNDKEGYLTGKEIAGWIIQQEKDADANLILGNLKDAAKAQNEAAKRKKNVITDFVGLFENLKSKWTKEKKLKIKTKELTRVIITDGKFI